MALTESQKKHLRGIGHKLNPVVTVGDAGLTAGVLAELESTIAHHELIKVRVRVGDREARDALIRDLATHAGAEVVQRIGNVALVYRENPEKRKVLLPP